MTKITLLHFASPFAFSMPAPVQASVRPATGFVAAAQDDTREMISRSARTGAIQSLPADDRASSFDSAAADVGNEGFTGSAYDAALRRYLEQQASQADLAAAGPEPASEAAAD